MRGLAGDPAVKIALCDLVFGLCPQNQHIGAIRCQRRASRRQRVAKRRQRVAKASLLDDTHNGYRGIRA